MQLNLMPYNIIMYTVFTFNFSHKKRLDPGKNEFDFLSIDDTVSLSKGLDFLKRQKKQTPRTLVLDYPTKQMQ